MKTTLLISAAAAAVLLTAGAAPADTLKNVAPERAPAAQRNAPAEKIAPPMHAGERKAPETTGQGPRALAPGRGGNAELKGTVDAGVRADDPDAKAGAKANIKAGADVKAQQKSDDSAKASSSGQSATGDKSDASQPSRKAVSGQSTATTGQGAAAGAAKLSSEQKTQIASVITQQDVERIEPADLNVSIQVGTRLPTHLHYYPLPPRVVAIYSAWEGFNFILVGDQIVIIDPGTHEIVAILEA